MPADASNSAMYCFIPLSNLILPDYNPCATIIISRIGSFNKIVAHPFSIVYIHAHAAMACIVTRQAIGFTMQGLAIFKVHAIRHGCTTIRERELGGETIAAAERIHPKGASMC